MTTDIKNLCEGYHLLEQELYDSAVLDNKIEYSISKDAIGKWIYFDKDNNDFMSAEDYNSILQSVINTGDYSLANTCEERIEDLCELNIKSKILPTPVDGEYEEAFYQLAREDFEAPVIGVFAEEEDIGDYVYLDNGDALVDQRNFEGWNDTACRENHDYPFQVTTSLIAEMLRKLNSEEYMKITQEQIDKQNADYNSSYLSGTVEGDWVYDDGEVLASQDCVYDWASNKSNRKDDVSYNVVFGNLKKFNEMDYRKNGNVSPDN